MAAALALADVLANLAERAVSLRYVQPELVDEPGLRIEGGRHPVVERVLDDPVRAERPRARGRRGACS